MRTNLFPSFLVCFGLMLLGSCAKDVDFDQANEVALRPVVELNLIFFDLQFDRFFDQETGQINQIVRDTTEIRFLDDSGTQESLQRVDFLFRFTNSIDRTFQVDFRFISQQNDTVYTIPAQVINGSVSAPVLTEIFEVVEGDQIMNLTMANRLVVETEIASADPGLEGNLNLQSKTTYFFEIKERE
ncbi:hypothetical protein [Aureitalea marina]|uniref:Uncharacterized protein n=1 Tax=Aureitalea marina TaxID=930804 RepID=A0A2S7KQT3_9FLAO|nr:hypothetical protein [Aureitalea marina]PQB04957.1 hypothetical protein BST85_08675 [Aureitalea marina]